MRIEEAREPVISVRPTKDGKWAVVKTFKGEDAQWTQEWIKWWADEGEALQRKHPDWWRKA